MVSSLLVCGCVTCVAAVKGEVSYHLEIYFLSYFILLKDSEFLSNPCLLWHKSINQNL